MSDPDAGGSTRAVALRVGSLGLAVCALVWFLVLFAIPSQGVTRAVAGPRHDASVTHRSTSGDRPSRPSGRRGDLARGQLTVSPGAHTTAVPRSFLGVSTEYWGLPVFEQHLRLFERTLSLFRVPGSGPLILRVGGDSADRTFWDPNGYREPTWAYAVTPAWLRRTSALVHRLGLRLILDMNLVTGTAQDAARLAAAEEAGLPRGSIIAFEIGNEPDIYDRPFWIAMFDRWGIDGDHLLPRAVSAISYTQDFLTYAGALERIAPGATLLGPAVAHPDRATDWISTLISGAAGELGMVSAHLYPFSACVARSSRSYPTISRLLSNSATVALARRIGPALRIARRAGLELRLTELNSVTCGGKPGVSNTFATALWAPDALFSLVHAGVAGVNIHVRASAINAPFRLTDRGLQARPLLYGLILFSRTLGPDARLVDLHLHANSSLHLNAWAVQVGGDVLHVLLLDKGEKPVRVDLRVPATGPATVERLIAPSTRSESHVTLDGQRLSPRATWEGRAAGQTIEPGRHGYEVTIARASAALLAVHLRPGALV